MGMMPFSCVPVAQPRTFYSPSLQGRVPGQTFPLPLDASFSVMGAVDNFNRPDGAGLGPNWTEDNATKMNIVGGRLAPPTVASYAFARYTANGQPANDQFAEFTVANFVGGPPFGTGYFRPRVRAGVPSSQGYSAEFSNAAGYRLWRNSDSTLLASSGFTPTIGDVIRLEAEGTTIRIKRNGIVIASATDATDASGWAGLDAYGPSQSDQLIDDFKCGDLVSNPVKKTSHGLAAGMSTFAGAVTKLSTRFMTAAMSTFAGSLVKQAAHLLAAAMSTFAGATVKQTNHLLAAGMSTFAGGVAKQCRKALAAGMSTFSGALSRAVAKFLAAGMATFSAQLNKLTRHALVAAMSTLDALLNTLTIRAPGRFTLAAIRLRAQLAARLDAGPQHRVRDLKVRGDD